MLCSTLLYATFEEILSVFRAVGAFTIGPICTPSVPGVCGPNFAIGRFCICSLCADVTDPIVVIDVSA